MHRHRRHHRGLIGMAVGAAVGAAMANSARNNQPAVIVAECPTAAQTVNNPCYPNAVQVVHVPPSKTGTTVMITAPTAPMDPPQPPQQSKADEAAQGYSNYPNQPGFSMDMAPPPYEEKPIPGATCSASGAAMECDVQRRYFLIINEANCSVLEMDHGAGRPGSRLVLREPRPDKQPRQMWYLGNNGVIRSMINNFALECNGSEHITLEPYNLGDARQAWTFKSNRIMNDALPGECVGLKKLLFLSNEADVIVSKYDNKPYQHWRVEYQ